MTRKSCTNTHQWKLFFTESFKYDCLASNSKYWMILRLYDACLYMFRCLQLCQLCMDKTIGRYKWLRAERRLVSSHSSAANYPFFQREIWVPLGRYPVAVVPKTLHHIAPENHYITHIYRWYMVVCIWGNLPWVGPNFSL